MHQVSGKVRLLLVGILIFILSDAQCQDFAESQNRVKAIYLYNFIKNIEWSNEGSANFKVCLLEKDGFYNDLEKIMATRRKGSKNIQVEAITNSANCRQCDLVFIGGKQAGSNVRKDPQCPSLFVTEGFYEKSLSDIALLYHENKLHFSVDLEQCNKEGFKVPSEFLLLANQKLIQP